MTEWNAEAEARVLWSATYPWEVDRSRHLAAFTRAREDGKRKGVAAERERTQSLVQTATGLLIGLEMGPQCRHCGHPADGSDGPRHEEGSDCAEFVEALRTYNAEQKET